MCQEGRRKTALIHITISSKIFANIKDAITCADAIKVWMTRFCEKNENYSIISIIGISENNCRHGCVVPKKSGKAGRPRKVFSGCDNIKVLPHIHMIMLANPGETARKGLLLYLNEKFEKAGYGAKGNVNIQEVYDINGLVRYVLYQSKHIRTVEYNKSCVLSKENDYGFSSAIGNVKSAHKIIFTSLINVENDSIVMGEDTITNGKQSIESVK